jgi:hypothetical protein
MNNSVCCSAVEMQRPQLKSHRFALSVMTAADHPESEKKAPEESSDKKTLRTDDDSSKEEDSKDTSEDTEKETEAAAGSSDEAESSEEDSEEESEEGAEKPISKEATDKLAKAVKSNADYQFSEGELSSDKPAQKCEEYSEYDYYVSPASPEPSTKCSVCIKMRNGPCPHTFRLWER